MTAKPESYRTLVHFLRTPKAEFHTFQLKEDKPIRVVIRNSHPTTPTDLIKSELKTCLFEVRQVSSVLHKISKIPLLLLFVDLEPTDQSKDIYKLTPLFHTLIKVEEPYKPKNISQCSNCQDYGHTNPTMVIKHAVSAAVPFTWRLTVQSPGMPLQNAHSAPGTIRQLIKAARSTGTFNDEKNQSHLTRYLIIITLKILMYKKLNQWKSKLSPNYPSGLNYTYAQATSNSNANNTLPSPP